MTKTLSVPSDKELTPYKAKATRSINQIDKLEIKSEDDEKRAGEILKSLKDAKRELRENKESVTKPINEGLKTLRSWFKPVEQRLDEAEKTVAGKILAYRREQEELQAKKDAELEDKVDKGEITDDQALEQAEQQPEIKKTVHTTKGAVTEKETEYVEIEDESKIPREYLVPDMVKINDHALGRRGHERREITGVVVKVRKTLV